MTIETCADLAGYFRSLVAMAMRRQRVSASPETTDYISGVLVTFAARPAAEFLDRPIVTSFEEAIAMPGSARRVALQSVGDGALCLSGLFSEHVERAVGSTRVHVHVGAVAYHQAAELPRDEGAPEPVALEELSAGFTRFVDVLAEVAESQALGGVTKSIVQLYDCCKNSNSLRAAEEMARRGTFPAKGGRS